ncbi:MAG: RHS repeat-associated core domain-containing protein, partial [Dysgonomonas sp.]|nr:RHS repeat-associated core domain-containing protein [Dysgonomonas sp.]
MYYDNKKRLIQSKSTNHLNGMEEEYIAYNFTGQPTKKMHVHSATGKTTQTEYYTYEYDPAGRLLKTKHKLNSGNEVLLADNSYDELGRLKSTKSNNQDKLAASYTYNVRSWLSTIRHYHFHEDLTYSYNGNITAVQWTQGGKPRKYAYTYDGLSQLKSAAYTGIGSEKYNTAYTYDKHGNMKTVQRYGRKDAGTGASSYSVVDQLTFNHNGNQLIWADDTAPNITYAASADFKDKKTVNGTIEYTYNLNGAMRSDLNKGITEIQYNSLNLPISIEVDSDHAKGRIKYTYSASGAKLKTIHETDMSLLAAPMMGIGTMASSAPKIETTDYVANKIYENGTLKRILIDGGYIEGGTYHFYAANHL